MVRSSLPQNYCKSSGTLLEDFETIDDWSIVAGSCAGTVSADTAHFKTGTKSLSLNVTGRSGYFSVEKTINMDLRSMNDVSFYVYCSDVMPTSGIEFIFIQTVPVTKYMLFSCGNTYLRPGWNLIRIAKSSFTIGGGCGWETNFIRLRVRLYADPASDVSVSFDKVMINNNPISRCLLVFDDGAISQYTVAYPYMSARDIVGNIGCVSSFPGSTGMTLAQFQEVYAAGWGILNHSTTHPSFGTLTAPQVITEYETCRDYLVDNGMSRGAKHFLYPGGYHAGIVLAAMAQTDAITGRSYGNPPMLQSCPPDNFLDLTTYNIQKTTALTTVIGWIDTAILTGNTVILTLHQILASPSNAADWSVANFQGLIDYLVSVQPLIRCVSMDEWYNGLTNPRYRSLPVTRA